MTQPRCINLDWLEVHVTEVGDPHDAVYFSRRGFVVHQREYGTRVWNQVLTLDGTDGHPLLEIRRQPKTPILNEYDSTIRLVNRTCYRDDAAELMMHFISTYEYQFHRITRVDICLDFEHFDYGDDPMRFMERYIRGVYSKINQANIHAHGTDQWNGRVWNSVSWGSPTSDIGTKFYNKTMELYDPITNTYAKPHIRQAWLLCGLIDDVTHCTKHKEDGTVYTPQIWRVEFSIRSSVKRWFVIELNGKAKAYNSIRNELQMYDTREKLLTLFFSLAQHYFHFKKYIPDQRKDRCPDKPLWRTNDQQSLYKVGKSEVLSEKKADRSISILRNKIIHLRNSKYDETIKHACDIIIKALDGDILRAELANPFSRDELIALQAVMREKTSGNNTDATILIKEIKELLKLNDNVAPFF